MRDLAAISLVTAVLLAVLYVGGYLLAFRPYRHAYPMATKTAVIYGLPWSSFRVALKPLYEPIFRYEGAYVVYRNDAGESLDETGNVEVRPQMLTPKGFGP